MESFIKIIVKISVILAVIWVLLLLSTAVLLLFAPKLVLGFLYYGVIVCLLTGAGWLAVSLLRKFVR